MTHQTAETELCFPSRETFDTLRDTGAIRALAPLEFGGVREPIAALARRVTQIAAWDSEAGWFAAHNAIANLAVSSFPAAVLGEVWGGGQDVVIGGTLAVSETVTLHGEAARVLPSSLLESNPYADWFVTTVLNTETGDKVRVLISRTDMSITKATNDQCGLGGEGSNVVEVNVPFDRVRELTNPAVETTLAFIAELLASAAVVGMARSASSNMSRIFDDALFTHWDQWPEQDKKTLYESAIDQMDRAEALFEGALAAMRSETTAGIAAMKEQSRAAKLTASAVAEAEQVVPKLLRSLGGATLAATHPLVVADLNISTKVRHIMRAFEMSPLHRESRVRAFATTPPRNQRSHRQGDRRRF